MGGQERGRTARWSLVLRIGVVLGLLILALSSAAVGRADSHIQLQADDVGQLIDAINIANGAPGILHEIVLTAPDYELVAVNNNTSGPNGLPAISGQVQITGNGATIRRAEDAPTFRIFRVISGGELHLENVTVSNGQATGLFQTNHGGGILISGAGTVTLTTSTVTDNNATSGGGISNRDTGALSLTNSSVIDNIAVGDGGGIHNTGTLSLTDSAVSDNTASFSGGGIRNGGDGTLSNSTVSGNSAGSQGGGIYTSTTLDNPSVTMELINSTISGNVAANSGGGIYNTGSATLEVINSTVSDNEANSNGGGISNSASATLILSSSLVAANSSSDINGGVSIGSSYNLIGNGAGMTGLTHDQDGNLVGNAEEPIDPRLDPAGLQDNGGPTETIALLADSPALDQIPDGTNGCGDETAQTPIVTDQRGIDRPQGDGCDIGAFELEVDDEDPVVPAERRDCKQGGWQEFGFRNQGLCIQFVNTGIDSR